MMANNDMSRWCVLYTAPKSERKLVQRLHAAGYMAFCPMQIVFKKWRLTSISTPISTPGAPKAS